MATLNGSKTHENLKAAFDSEAQVFVFRQAG